MLFIMGKIVTFGEIMLRLKSPAKERLFQSGMLESVFGGSEANVAVSLAIFGKESEYVTALPDNDIGRAVISSLSYYGVNVNSVNKEGRLGIYFLEDGACQRPSKVIYDRSQSCLAVTPSSEYNWKNIMTDATWFHLSGVTPAVSQIAADCAFDAIKTAKQMGVTVSLDLNYRKKLWKYGKSASQVMTELAKMADVIIANEEDIQSCLGISLRNFNTTTESYRDLCQQVKKQYPNVKIVAVTLRHSYSADKNGWSTVMLGTEKFYESTRYEIENIVERVGAGDSFAAGLIYGLTEFNDEQKSLEFATAASCLKHSICGDFNLSTKDEVIALMNGNSTGRIQR